MTKSRRRRECAVADHLRGASALHRQQGRRGLRQDLQRAGREGRACRTRTSRCRRPPRTPPGRSSRRACVGANSLDDKAIAAWLKKNKVDTIQGKLRFDGPSNYGDDLMKIKQVQDGKWVVVWPKEFAAPGASCRPSSAARRQMTLPSFNLLVQSILSGIFIGAPLRPDRPGPRA